MRPVRGHLFPAAAPNSAPECSRGEARSLRDLADTCVGLQKGKSRGAGRAPALLFTPQVQPRHCGVSCGSSEQLGYLPEVTQQGTHSGLGLRPTAARAVSAPPCADW